MWFVLFRPMSITGCPARWRWGLETRDEGEMEK
jgi:hypothetical protein